MTRIDTFRSTLLSLAAAALALSACTGKTTATTDSGQPTTVAVDVRPHTASLAVGASRNFTVTVTGTTDLAVTWTVEPPGCGSIAGTGATVTYTAPATAGTCRVRATSHADDTKSYAATVTVVNAAVVVDVQPPTATVQVNATTSFTATVSGSTDHVVAWSVEPVGCGTVTQAGSYTAPATTGSCTVRATSHADPTSSGTATVNVVGSGGGTTYHVGWSEAGASCTGSGSVVCVATTGTGASERAIANVPWYQLGPGDTVYIHKRSTGGRAGDGAYHEKIYLSGQGTATQWIRVLGVPDGSGNLPVIDGANAITPTTSHNRWTGWNVVQYDYVIGAGATAEDAGSPAYIEIAQLEVRNGSPAYTFTAEDGTTGHPYEDFAACIHLRAPQHALVRDNVLHDCGQGLYNWTADGSDASNYWGQVAVDVTIRGNYFYNNGWSGVYTSHQSYTEADGVVIEGNRYGTPKSGMLGSQIKDRSAGSIVRYNWIEQSPMGWDIDLVEPEAGCPALGYSTCVGVSGSGINNGTILHPPGNPKYLEAWVYGNVFDNPSNTDPNFIHWNEDHNSDTYGRAVLPAGRLYLYDNTFANRGANNFSSFVNETDGGFNCPGIALPGRVVMWNNIIYSGAAAYQLGEYCTKGNFDFYANWLSPGWTGHYASATGTGNLTTGTNATIGFTAIGTSDYRLTASSAALGLGVAGPAAVTSNSTGHDLTPTLQYVYPHTTPTPTTAARAQGGAGSDAGAFER